MKKLLAALLAAASCAVFAQGPNGPIRLVVPTTAGGPLDAVARMLALPMGRDTKENVIVENRPGAAAMIGTDYVAKAPPDGRTLLVASGFVITNALTQKAAPDPIRDLKPVIELTHAGMVVAVRQGLDVRTPADLRRAASQQPGGLNCAAPPGEAGLACEQLKQFLGGSVVSVPYPGVAPAVNALLGGMVDIVLAPYDAVLPFVGRITPIATTGVLPAMAPFDRLPLLKDQFPGFVVVGFLGIMAPPGTPDDVVRTLNQQFQAALKEPQVRDFMLARGSTMDDDSPPEKFGRTLAERLTRYRAVAESAGIRPQ